MLDECGLHCPLEIEKGRIRKGTGAHERDKGVREKMERFDLLKHSYILVKLLRQIVQRSYTA